MAPSNKVRDYLNRDMWEHPILRPFAKILIPIQQTIIFGSVVFFLIALPLGLYMILEKSGWVPNNHETPVWIQGDWLVGESRSCQMRTKTAPDREKKLDSVDKLPRLFCGEDANGLFDFQTTLVSPPADVQVPKQGSMYFISVTGGEADKYFHIMPVRYFGRIDRTDKWVVSWRCQRHSEFLECRARLKRGRK